MFVLQCAVIRNEKKVRLMPEFQGLAFPFFEGVCQDKLDDFNRNLAVFRVSLQFLRPRPGCRRIVREHRHGPNAGQEALHLTDAFLHARCLVHSRDVVSGAFDGVDQAVFERGFVHTPENDEDVAVDVVVPDEIGGVVVAQEDDIGPESVDHIHNARGHFLDFPLGVSSLCVHPCLSHKRHRTFCMIVPCVRLGLFGVKISEIDKRVAQPLVGCLRPKVIAVVTADNENAPFPAGRAQCRFFRGDLGVLNRTARSLRRIFACRQKNNNWRYLNRS